MDPRQNGSPPQHRQLQNAQRQHQRFSWQDPAPGQPQQQQPQVLQQAGQPQQQYQQQPQASSNVNSHSRGFSYAQTPIEHRSPQFTSNEPLPHSSDPRHSLHKPQYPAVPSPTQPPAQSYPQDSMPPAYDDEMAMSPLSPHHGTLPFSPVSPMHPPRIQTDVHPRPNHARQRSNLSPINTNVGSYTAAPPLPALPADPLPQKHENAMTPISPTALKREPTHPVSPTSHSGPVAEPYSPHGFNRNPTHTIFSPDSTHGPNGLDFALHQPGQIAHPNMESAEGGNTKTWKHSLFSCTPIPSDCLTGIFCPCILYGKTSHRLSQKSAKKDPTDLLSYKATNGHCMVMGAACGLWWLFPMMQRMKIRHMYKIDGGCLGDFARGCCCCCCVAVQNEREVREREEKARRFAGPASSEVYRRAVGMEYKAQQ